MFFNGRDSCFDNTADYHETAPRFLMTRPSYRSALRPSHLFRILKPTDLVPDNLARIVAQFVTFRIDGQAYAFRIDQIREIVILNQVTRIPQVPDYVEGVANLRGSIIPILNLRTLFGLPTKPHDSDTRTIVVHVGERLVGCQVDSVTQVVRIDHDAIRPAPDTVTGHGASYIAGFARVQEQLVVLIDINELLDPQKLEQVGRWQVPELPNTKS